MFVVIDPLLTSCKQKSSTLRHQIVGTWELGESFEMILDASGVFHSQSGSSNSIKQIDYFGTWQIEDGFFIMALTNVSAITSTNFERVGSVDRFKIIKMDNTNLMLESDRQPGWTNTYTRK